MMKLTNPSNNKLTGSHLFELVSSAMHWWYLSQTGTCYFTLEPPILDDNPYQTCPLISQKKSNVIITTTYQTLQVPNLNMYMEFVSSHKTSILTVSKCSQRTQFINFCEVHINLPINIISTCEEMFWTERESEKHMPLPRILFLSTCSARMCIGNQVERRREHGCSQAWLECIADSTCTANPSLPIAFRGNLPTLKILFCLLVC